MNGQQSLWKNLKYKLLGTPLSTAVAHEERLSKRRALAVFSSDNLSSVAYATEEILRVLILAGSLALAYSVGISVAICGLLFIVVSSYLQTLREYPMGGGAYTVAKENLGELPSLTAGAALLIDYILTVAVSVAAGVAAITSAFPTLFHHRIALCMAAIAILTIGNLRGLRESAKIFAIPTYAFILSIVIMIFVGLYQYAKGSFESLPAPVMASAQPITLFLLLHAFSAGCTAMTGVEAISNGVPSFQYPESRNASVTMIIMGFLLVAMFLGITLLSHAHGIVPTGTETVVSQVARSIFGTSTFYYVIQITTMSILILAANTSYNGFPRLASILAHDRYLPRQLASLGDRLVFSNGILLLGLSSAFLIFIFDADTHALIPLYAVGVFLSFTLSQAGMVVLGLRERNRNWLRSVVVNTVGCLATTIVTLIIAATKLVDGAWVIIVLLPIFILTFRHINKHYLSVAKQLSLIGASPKQFRDSIKHTVLIPISGIHKGVLEALRYARSISSDVRAVYVEIDSAQSLRLQEEWQSWGHGIPLVVLKSPYRSIITPFLHYVDEVESLEHDDIVTIVIPEFVTAKWWESLFHNQTAFLIRASLLFSRGKVVTSVRYHLD